MSRLFLLSILTFCVSLDIIAQTGTVKGRVSNNNAGLEFVNVVLQGSALGYGNTIYIADQYIGFGQLTWNKQVASRHDPGQVIATPDNPHALTFDPTYVFAPNQGIRGFLGVRYILNE